MEDPGDMDAFAKLDRFFEELRLEIRSNPDLANRLVKAIGAEVVFEGSLAAKLINPRELAATKPEAAFRDAFSAMTAAEIRSVLKAHNLASTVDMKGLKPPALIDMAYERALAKANERQGPLGQG
ncbi:MAG: hypothetical protein AAGK23_06800 [Pseudomonadota bacterium]